MANSTTTITWSIAQLERHTADGIVYTAHWTVNAIDTGSTGSAEGTFSASAGAYGSVGFEVPGEDDTIIPFEDLTEELVLGWVKDKLGEETVSSTEAALIAQIAEQLAPKSTSGVPW